MINIEFNQYRLEDICELITDGSHSSPKSTKSGMPMASVKDMTEIGIDYSKCRRISFEDFNKIKKQNCSPILNDILVSKDGSVMSEVIVNKNPEEIVLLSSIAILRTKKEFNPYYLKYYLKSPSVDNLIKSGYVTGTVLPRIILKDFKRLPIFIPKSKKLENSIAFILKLLDDKIELNINIIKTLSNTTKAIFKSWFINFDPVKAKSECRVTGLPKEIINLFPDSFEDSEMGEIPKGWMVTSLKNCSLEIESGSRPKGGIDKNLNEGIPSVGAESIYSAGMFDYSKIKYVSSDFANNVFSGWVKNYDVALYKDGAMVGDPSRVSLFGEQFPFKKFMVNEHTFLIRSGLLGQFFLYQLLQTPQASNYLNVCGASKGAQPGLNQEEIKNLKFVCPENNIIEKFDFLTKNMVIKQLSLGKQILSIKQIRDALIPKLISGKLRLKDAEKYLEKADI